MKAEEREMIQRNDKDRRTGRDRRQFSYAGHIPERRSGEERRIDLDRRH